MLKREMDGRKVVYGKESEIALIRMETDVEKRFEYIKEDELGGMSTIFLSTEIT